MLPSGCRGPELTGILKRDAIINVKMDRGAGVCGRDMRVGFGGVKGKRVHSVNDK